MNQIYWQDEPNYHFFTNKKEKCEICGRKPEKYAEMRFSDDVPHFCCWEFDGRNCFKNMLNLMFGTHVEEYLRMRLLTFKQLKKIAREPVGLSKRYQVLKRDGFKCQSCGVTSKERKLEIDHIIPVSSGGDSSMKNLQA